MKLSFVPVNVADAYVASTYQHQVSLLPSE